MKDFQLFNEISSLPEDIKKEVSDFISFLKYKVKAKMTNHKFGYAKGFFLNDSQF